MGVRKRGSGLSPVIFEYQYITKPGVVKQVPYPLSKRHEHIFNPIHIEVTEIFTMIGGLYNHLMRSGATYHIEYPHSISNRAVLYLKGGEFIWNDPYSPPRRIGL